MKVLHHNHQGCHNSLDWYKHPRHHQGMKSLRSTHSHSCHHISEGKTEQYSKKHCGKRYHNTVPEIKRNVKLRYSLHVIAPLRYNGRPERIGYKNFFVIFQGIKPHPDDRIKTNDRINNHNDIYKKPRRLKTSFFIFHYLIPPFRGLYLILSVKPFRKLVNPQHHPDTDDYNNHCNSAAISIFLKAKQCFIHHSSNCRARLLSSERSSQMPGSHR